MIFNADFFSWFNLRLYIFIPKHKQKLLHAFSRITVRLTGRKPVMLAAGANENTWRLFCGSLICFSVASFSDAFNKTQHFLCDKSTFQIPKLYSTHRVQPSERQRSEWTANDSFLRLLFASRFNSSCYTEHVQPTTWDIDISIQRPRVSSKLTILERFVTFLLVSFKFKVIADALRLSLKKT